MVRIPTNRHSTHPRERSLLPMTHSDFCSSAKLPINFRTPILHHGDFASRLLDFSRVRRHRN